MRFLILCGLIAATASLQTPARASDAIGFDELPLTGIRVQQPPHRQGSPPAVAAQDAHGERPAVPSGGPDRATSSPRAAKRALGTAAGITGTIAGTWGTNAASKAIGWAALGPRLVTGLGVGGAGVLGALANAGVQYASQRRVDWGSVVATSAGAVAGMALAGPIGSVAGGVFAQLAWDAGRTLWTARRGPSRRETQR